MQDIGIIQTVATNVRLARKAAGLSQEELALEAEVDRTYISQVERGKRNITIAILARLARAMGTTAAALVSAAREEFRVIRSIGRSTDLIKALSHCWVIPCAVPLYERWWGDWASIVSQL